MPKPDKSAKEQLRGQKPQKPSRGFLPPPSDVITGENSFTFWTAAAIACESEPPFPSETETMTS